LSSQPFERGPDEEGIETARMVSWSRSMRSNADLMKKGLRHGSRKVSPKCLSSNADLMKKGLRHIRAVSGTRPIPFERGPDEEGIETFSSASNQGARIGSNADLMKKGLRLVRPH